MLQFSNRMTDLIVAGSPELSLITRTQLMTSLGLLSMKTMELCQAWDQFEYAYKSTGIPWPHDFDVAFPKKHAEEEDQKKGGVKEPKPKKTKRKHTGDTVVPPPPSSRQLVGPLVGTLDGTLDGIQKRHLRKMIPSFPKRRSTMTSRPLCPC